jgi:hypothetical protein
MIILLAFLNYFGDDAMSEKKGCGCSGSVQGSADCASKDASKDEKKKEVPSVGMNCCG